MENKNFLNEIYRIQELMSINKPLLLENRYVDFFTEMIDDFMTKSTKVIKGVRNELTVGAMKIEKSLLDDFTNVLNGVKRLEDLPENSIKIFAKVVRQSADIVDDVYEKLMTEFVTASGVRESVLVKKITDELNRGKTMSEILTEMNGGVDDVFLHTLIAPKMLDKVKQYKKSLLDKKPFVEVVPPPISKTRLSGAIEDIDFESLTPAEAASWFKRRLMSNKTVFNVFRRGINELVDKAAAKGQSMVKEVETVFSEISGTMSRISEDLKNMNSDEILTEFRGISTKIKNLQIKYDADLDALYAEIENKLKKELAGEDKFVEEFMKKMKENDPFSLTNSFPTLNTYWLNFLNNTASMKLKYNFGRTLKTLFTLKKQFFSEFFELSQRIITFLFTGSPKSWTEIAQYFRTYGTAKGIGWFATDLWVATHVGMPLVLGLYETFGNLVLLNFTSNKGEEKGKVSIDLFGNIADQYKSQYENEDGKVTKPSIFWGLLSPGHYYFDDLVLDYLDKSEKGEKRKPLVDWVKKPDWKKIKEEYKIPDSTQQKIEKILDLPTRSEVDSALNNMKSELDALQQKADSTISAQKFELGATEEGFKNFAGTSYKSFNKATTVGTKTDGTQWQYDESTSTWIPF